MKQRSALWHGLACLAALLLSFVVFLAVLIEQFDMTIDSYLGMRSVLLVSEDDGTLYTSYTPDEGYLNSDGTGNSTAIIQKAIDLGHQEGAEGTVLLKNENGALPLESSDSDKAKVTLLGLRSHVPLLGSGMGVKVQGPMITLEDALSRDSTDWNNADKWATSYHAGMDEFAFDGADYELNPETIAFYDEYNDSAGKTYNDRVSTNINEPDVADMTDLVDGFADYDDAAIVVLGRSGSEASDYLPGEVTEGQGNSEPLALTTNEKDLLELAKENFDRVIVLINSCNALEIDDLKHDDEIDAILNINFPGAYGMLGVADILSGKVSPSGALADINAAYQMSAPAMQNMGDYEFANADDITRTKSYNYVMEAEGIYVGYRYYETRYNDVVEGRGNASSATGVYASTDSWDYSKEVTYGFGYGLSYTSFTQEITDVEVHQSEHEITMDFTVDVTNTGDMEGKSIVQIYGQAPYTDGGLEKSAIQLLSFGKTDTLAAGESEEVTVEVDLQNLASYDSSVDNGDGTYGTYVFDEGDYYFAVGNGAHDALNNVLAAQGKTTDDGMDYDGDAGQVYAGNYSYAGGSGVDTETFSVSKNGTEISNQLPYADFNYYQDGYVTYLSRSDWSGTFPKEYDDVTAPESMMDDLNGEYYDVETEDDTSEYVWESTETEYKLYQMKGADWDDERWDDMLSQMSINESMYLAAFGGPVLPSSESVGLLEYSMTENNGNGIVYSFAQNLDPSAPWSVATDDSNAYWNGQVFGSSPLLASTFNMELFKELGEFVGNESLFLGVPIIWGPGLNTHRQAYNGRNCEYYSEDPILCGYIAMEFSYGCAEYGLIAAPKHFAFNDQETNRKGVAPFMTEQRAREVELRAYQIAIEAPKYDDFGMFGLMTSFSKIGAVECTASRGLLTDILKEEWGFHGYAVTDIYDDTDLYSACVYAGITGYDLRAAEGFDTSKPLNTFTRFMDGTQVESTPLDEDAFKGDADMMQALRVSNKNLLWALAQSNLMNRYNSTTEAVWQMTSLRVFYIVAIVVMSLLTVGAVFMCVRPRKKEKEAK